MLIQQLEMDTDMVTKTNHAENMVYKTGHTGTIQRHERPKCIIHHEVHPNQDVCDVDEVTPIEWMRLEYV